MSNQEKSKIWLGIGNIIVTLIVGVIITLTVNAREESLQLELAEREEALQRELVELKAQTDRISNFTQLKQERVCVSSGLCGAAVEIRNVGLSAAEDVQIVVYIESVRVPWEQTVVDIEQFSFEHFPAPIDVSIEPTRVDVRPGPGQLSSGNNAVEILIETLPPDSSVQIRLDFTGESSVDIYHVSREVTFYLDSEAPPPTTLSEGELVWPYLEEEHSIARFATESSCKNCTGGVETLGFFVSSIEVWGRGFRSLSEDDLSEGIYSRFNSTVTYTLPEGTVHSPDTSPLEFEIVGFDNDGRPILQRLGGSRAQRSN